MVRVCVRRGCNREKAEQLKNDNRQSVHRERFKPAATYFRANFFRIYDVELCRLFSSAHKFYEVHA